MNNIKKIHRSVGILSLSRKVAGSLIKAAIILSGFSNKVHFHENKNPRLFRAGVIFVCVTSVNSRQPLSGRS